MNVNTSRSRENRNIRECNLSLYKEHLCVNKGDCCVYKFHVKGQDTKWKVGTPDESIASR